METLSDEWAYWIKEKEEESKYSKIYDRIAELAVSSYELTSKERYEYRIDEKHCFVIWWYDNKNRFKKYHTITALSKLLKINHSTLIHYMNHRKKSFRYDENTRCLNDFLNS